MKNKAQKGFALVALLLVYLLFGLIFFGLGALCFPYVINTWLVFAGKAAIIQWWQGGLLGIIPVIGQLSIISAIFTWIIFLFL